MKQTIAVLCRDRQDYNLFLLELGDKAKEHAYIMVQSLEDCTKYAYDSVIETKGIAELMAVRSFFASKMQRSHKRVCKMYIQREEEDTESLIIASNQAAYAVNNK